MKFKLLRLANTVIAPEYQLAVVFTVLTGYTLLL